MIGLSKKIPVFLHIPRNAGTYILTFNMGLFHYYASVMHKWHLLLKDNHVHYQIWNERLKRLHVLDKDGQTLFIVFVVDQNSTMTKEPLIFKQSETDAYQWSVSYEDFVNRMLYYNMLLFSIVVESPGFKSYIQDFNKVFQELLLHECELYSYMCLRDPLSRAHSMFSYISSANSKHEVTHNTLQSKNFKEYISSYEVEDCWLIRTLFNIPDNTIIDENHFTEACCFFDKCKIFDISCIDNSMQEIFNDCHNIDVIQAINDKNYNFTSYLEKNSCRSSTNIETTEEALNVFKKRAFWDFELYHKYIQNPKCVG